MVSDADNSVPDLEKQTKNQSLKKYNKIKMYKEGKMYKESQGKPTRKTGSNLQADRGDSSWDFSLC